MKNSGKDEVIIDPKNFPNRRVSIEMENKTAMTKRLNFAALSAWLIASITMAILALQLPSQDFRPYYAAARVVSMGGNPYDFKAMVPVLLESTGYIGNSAYFYAPWFAWLMIPFGWFSFPTSRGLWMLFNLIIWMFSLWGLSKLLEWPKPGWGRWLLFLLITYIFAWLTWRSEQVGILLFALFVVLLTALKGDKHWLAGVCLVLLLIKPNITLLPVLAICFWLARQREWRSLASMGVFALGFLVLSFLVTPNWYKPIFDPVFFNGIFTEQIAPGQVTGIRINSSLHDWLAGFGVSDRINLGIVLLAGVLGMILLSITTWKSTSVLEVAAVAILINFAITPYTLQYDYPILTLVMFWAIAKAQVGKRRWVPLMVSLIVLFVASIPIWERPISDGYWIVFGLIGITVLSVYNTTY